MAITKKIRFEVFKRDSFKCQYCGRSAPDIILEVDHIQPKSKGGIDDISNLLTSCFDCNRGKSNKKLLDNTEIKKQQIELTKLQKRREQLEWMMKWRKELQNLDNEYIDTLSKIFSQTTNHVFSEHGRQTIKTLIKKYTFKEVLESLDISLTQYYDKDKPDTVNITFQYIAKICSTRKYQEHKPYIADLFYIRGIIRNRFAPSNDWQILQLLEKAYLKPVTISWLQTQSLTVKNWSTLKDILEDVING